MTDLRPDAARDAVIDLRRVEKRYDTPQGAFTALTAIDLRVTRGECVAVVGKSGSGKTTLINLITGIDSASGGEVRVGDQDLGRLSQEALAIWRGRQVGVVFQFFQLLPTLTVLENVILPMDFARLRPRAEHAPRARALLDKLGIADQADKLPADLSGGQQQRAAIARALANDPVLIVADEPTGNLDTANADAVMRLLAEQAREGKTVLTVTHEREFSHYFTRTVSLRDGRIVDDTGTATP